MENKTNVGYACISIGINEGLAKKNQITVNRGMVKKTFELKGLDYVSELVIKNLEDTLKILEYNIRNDIYVYRFSSDVFPWMSHYTFDELPNFDIIKNKLENIGKFVIGNKIRMGSHPGQFNVLCSQNPIVVCNTVAELNRHSEIFDLMGLPQNNFYSVNIHIGTSMPSKEEASKRFCANFNLLSESCKKRLTIENDDKDSQYTIQDLYEFIHLKIVIPIIIDSLHFKCHDGGFTWEDSFKLAISTWGATKPLVHHSSSKKIWEDSSVVIQSHSDFLYEKFENFDIPVDIELECKMKDIALIKYRNDFLK